MDTNSLDAIRKKAAGITHTHTHILSLIPFPPSFFRNDA